MKDIFDPEVALWQKVEAMARDCFRVYHFQEIRTPLLESTDLFVRGIGGETGVVKKEMYTFLDKGEDSVTLRPEGTASVVRAFIEHHLDKVDPVSKLYYIGPMFRYERPQKGRLRQFHQIGAEIFGSSSPLSDVEMIGMLDGFVRQLGISSYSIQINSLGCKECRPIFEKQLASFLASKKETLCTECQDRLLRNPMRVFDCKKETCQKQLKEAPVMINHLCEPCRQHFSQVEGGLKGAGVNFNVNPRIARGLDYYQRTAFEFLSDQLGSQNAFAGGGRYDGLVQDLGGPEIPGVGFAIGLERLLLLLPEGIQSTLKEKKIYVAFLGGVGHCKAVGITRDLRNAGLICEMDYAEKSLKSQMRRADKLECDYVIILGDNEVQAGRAQVKDLSKRTQTEIPFDDLVQYFKISV